MTDLHFGSDGDDVNKAVERKLCLKGLIKTLSKLDIDWRPDIICLSGDIAWKGIESDYLEAKAWLDKLLEVVGVTYSHVLACAGNHDVERIKAKLLDRPKDFTEAQNLLKMPIPGEMLDVFQSFSNFCQNSGIVPYKTGHEDSFLWGERILDGVRFVTLNSSWFCKDDKDKENLWLGQKLLNYLEAHDQFPAIADLEDPMPTVVMMHHPFEWLDQEESHGFDNKINTKDYIAHRGHILITGHEHGEPRLLDVIAEQMYHSKSGATYSDGSYNNNARIFVFEGNSLSYRSLVYETGSPTREWRVTDPKCVSTIHGNPQPSLHRPSQVQSTQSNNLPHRLTVIPLDYGEFLGREGDLQNLTKRLGDTQKVVLVNGLGGIGKTTLAKRFVGASIDTFTHVIWISVTNNVYESENDNSDNFVEAFAENSLLFANMKLPFVIEGESLRARFIRLMNAIRNLQGNNLLVIDNVGMNVGNREIRDELPNPPNWKVLLTSKQRPAGYELIELSKITSQVSQELFFKYYTYESDLGQVNELLKEVDYHTLTVELLAKTLQAHYGEMSIESLLDRLRRKQLNAPEIQRRIITEHSEETEIFENLRIVFDVSDLLPSELRLLKQITLFPPQTYHINEQLGQALEIVTDEEKRSFHNTLNSLDRKGWIKVSDKTVEMHRMVHQMISYQVKSDWKDAKPVVRFFASSLNHNNYALPKNAWLGLSFAEYLIEILKNVKDLGYQEEFTELKHNLSAIYKEIGRLDDGRKLMEGVVKEALENLPEGHSNIFRYKNTLGLIYKNLKKYVNAEELLTEVAEYANKEESDDKFLTITYKSNLALLYKDMGRLKEALALYELALSESISIFKEESIETARCMGNLATIHQDLKNYARAASFLEEALRISLDKLLEDHPDIARYQGNLSLSYQRLGRVNEAVNLSRKALKAARDYYGMGHYFYILRMRNLGVAYSWAGQRKKCVDCLMEAFTLSKSVLGEKHPFMLDTKQLIIRLSGQVP